MNYNFLKQLGKEKEESSDIRLIEIPPEANLLIRKNINAEYIINKKNTGANLLEDMCIESYRKPWGKLENQLKINRVMHFAKDKILEYELNDEESKKLRVLLINLINNRMITKKTDVEYDIENGRLTAINGLLFNPITRKHTYTSDENAYISHVTIISPEQDKLIKSILRAN